MIPGIFKQIHHTLCEEFKNIEPDVLKYVMYLVLVNSENKSVKSFDEECTDILMHEHPDGSYSAADRREVMHELWLAMCRGGCEMKGLVQSVDRVLRAERRTKAKAKQSNGFFSASKGKQGAKAGKSRSKNSAAKKGGRSRSRGPRK